MLNNQFQTSKYHEEYIILKAAEISTFLSRYINPREHCDETLTMQKKRLELLLRIRETPNSNT